jgi:hypothetical protein
MLNQQHGSNEHIKSAKQLAVSTTQIEQKGPGPPPTAANQKGAVEYFQDEVTVNAEKFDSMRPSHDPGETVQMQFS